MIKVRCAIYTRKSSEEALDQEFNSLHAQREACEAYILSQKSQGWTSLPAHYDDGGFSGGTMTRPGLERLLADVRANKVDVVVVYKVDRLTRSLADFAKIVEILDASSASFVSVTQAFNTTSSMGRLTLNVLLSFAQFEREVTGERIRDKIAASKAKGMWMGGYEPLGYRVKERKLIVHSEEAAMVQHIFGRYLELKSVHALCAELAASGIASRVHTSAAGRKRGGVSFSRGALFHLLRNRLYLGEIVHKEKAHPGQHEAIIERELFQKVERQLAKNRVERRGRTAEKAPLCGLIHDAEGNRMSPTHSFGKKGDRYRYYVSSPAQRGQPRSSSARRRVAAPLLEQLVFERLRAISNRPLESLAGLRPFLRRIEVAQDQVTVELIPPPCEDWVRNLLPRHRSANMDDGTLRVSFDAYLETRGGETALTLPSAGAREVKHDRGLIQALRRAHRELEARSIRFIGAAANLSAARGVEDPYLRRLTTLAFLAPDIQRSILEGRQPTRLTLARLMKSDIPLDWTDQRTRFGFA